MSLSVRRRAAKSASKAPQSGRFTLKLMVSGELPCDFHGKLTALTVKLAGFMGSRCELDRKSF
jgi:hypothetical protein